MMHEDEGDLDAARRAAEMSEASDAEAKCGSGAEAGIEGGDRTRHAMGIPDFDCRNRGADLPVAAESISWSCQW